MPHFKCLACKTRLHSPAGPAGDLCPGCGSLLEPVGELAEIVGFRSIEPRAIAVDGGTPGTDRRSIDRVDDLIARREALLADTQLDAERWLDDDSSFSPEAVAEVMALPTLKEYP
jgi:hypothetical protein